MSLEEWAKKAREVLQERRVITDDYRDFDDEDVIALCDEYDQIIVARESQPMIDIVEESQWGREWITGVGKPHKTPCRWFAGYPCSCLKGDNNGN